MDILSHCINTYLSLSTIIVMIGSLSFKHITIIDWDWMRWEICLIYTYVLVQSQKAGFGKERIKSDYYCRQFSLLSLSIAAFHGFHIILLIDQVRIKRLSV